MAHDRRDVAHGPRQGRRRGRRALPASASPTSARQPSSGSGRPASRSTTPSSGRTGGPPISALGSGRRVARPKSQPRPGCCSIPISRPPRSPGCSTRFPAPARGPSAASSPSAPSTAFLLWRLTGGKAHATDATNASRTLSVRHPLGPVGRELSLAPARAGGDAAGGEGLRGRVRPDRSVRSSAPPFRCAASRAISRLRRSARPASSPAC